MKVENTRDLEQLGMNGRGELVCKPGDEGKEVGGGDVHESGRQLRGREKTLEEPVEEGGAREGRPLIGRGVTEAGFGDVRKAIKILPPGWKWFWMERDREYLYSKSSTNQIAENRTV